MGDSNPLIWYVTIGMFGDFAKWDPSMGPKTYFWGLGRTQGPKTHFFIFILISEANPIIWCVTIGMFGDFVKWDPSMGPNTHFWGQEGTQGPKTHFFHFNLHKWGKSFNLICHSKYVSQLWAIEPPNGPPKTPFWALERTHDPKTHFFCFDVNEGVKPFNLICHKVRFSLFLEILNLGAKKAFWPFSLKRKNLVGQFFFVFFVMWWRFFLHIRLLKFRCPSLKKMQFSGFYQKNFLRNQFFSPPIELFFVVKLHQGFPQSIFYRTKPFVWWDFPYKKRKKIFSKSTSKKAENFENWA